MLKPSRTLLAYWRVFLFFILIAALGLTPQSAVARSGIRSLEHLSTVRVLVEDLNHAAQQLGLQKEHIFNIAAQQLIKDGLTVLKPGIQLPAPIVYVRLSSVVGGTDANAPVGLYLTVQVKQFARQAHPPASEAAGQANPAQPAQPANLAKPHLVTTWENGTMVLTSSKELAFYTQNLLINLLADLVHDHHQASAGSST